MILDTIALSAFADGPPRLDDVLAAEIPTVPVIVLGEIAYGITHSTRKRAYEAWLDRYLPMFQILDIAISASSSQPTTFGSRPRAASTAFRY